jgi:hypothetical protein
MHNHFGDDACPFIVLAANNVYKISSSGTTHGVANLDDTLHYPRATHVIPQFLVHHKSSR